ncbi:MAG: NADH-quinone oxidoreductase subunit H [Candidatus Omnitrophica bacterium]|nr:NADH-quinone oxidoreductase subunit H [Candidatus Omnitrophota bacterium]
MKILFWFLIIPGFLFTSTVGLLASWIDRKVTARVQWRVGPPVLQPFIDVVKLLGKETILPRTADKITFLTAPVLGLVSITLISTILWVMIADPKVGFLGDLIVLVYLLAIPSISVIMGGFASGNPIASIGASREMKLLLSYELPFVLAVFVPVIKAGGIIRIGELLSIQAQSGAFATNISGFIALVVAIICMQAKLALVPFDMAEAETELIGGPIIEYSGTPLAIFKLTRASMLFTVPMFLVVIFMGGIVLSFPGIIWGILKYVLLLVIIVLIRNTNPRIRIDQAVKFFWGPVTVLAILAVVLAFIGV